MNSSHNPLTFPDTLKHILTHVSRSEFKKMQLVCKQWQKIILTPKQGLLTEFKIPEKIILSLTSLDLVYARLSKIFQRGKVDCLHEHKLYQLYCASGSINEDFIHLLDNNEKWFINYFDNKHPFFLACNLNYACISGNLDLVKFLVEKKNCELSNTHVKMAVASGVLELIKYLLEECKIVIAVAELNDVFTESIASGSVDVLSYIMGRFEWMPTGKNFGTAISSGSLEMVRLLHETYQCTANNISIFDILNSRSLKIIQYLVGTMGWAPRPKDIFGGGAEEINEIAYEMGMVDVVKYIEAQFPCAMRVSLTFANALRSGDSDTFKHLVEKLKLDLQGIKKIIVDLGSQCSLVQVLKSGNMDAVKFMIEKCQVKPEGADLLNAVIQSKSIEMVCYLVDEHKYEVTSESLKTACYGRNLELISFLFKRCENIDSDDISHFICSDDALMSVYHLMDKENYPANQNMLESAVRDYEWRERKDLISLFIQYLIDVHHLQPTDNMLDAMKQKGDQKMLAILQGEKSCEVDDAPQMQCRFI